MNDFICFYFDSSIGGVSYGNAIMKELLIGNELKKSKNTVVVSFGDILHNDYIDIEPYLIRNNRCTVSVNPIIKSEIFCVIFEDLESDISVELDYRLKKTNSCGYLGCSLLNPASYDKRKHFFDDMCRTLILYDCKAEYIIYSDDNYGSFEEIFKKNGYQIGYLPFGTEPKSSFIPYKSHQKKYFELVRNKLEMGINLNMEVRVAGGLVWDSVEKINNVSFLNLELGFGGPYLAEISYMVIYNAAQGIERLQKTLIELLLRKNNCEVENEQKMIQLLRSHKHIKLSQYIDNFYPLNEKVTSKCQKLCQILDDFYNKIRYNNYKHMEALPRDEFHKMLYKFKNKNGSNTNQSVRNNFCNILGMYAKCLYQNIRDISHELGIYTYELESDSKAALVFWGEEELINTYKNYQIAKMETILALAFNKQKLFDKLGLKPLSFDKSEFLVLLSSLINGRTHNFYNAVDALYDELNESNHKEFKKRYQIIKELTNYINDL